MHVRRDARAVSMEGAQDMAELRKCIGSKRYLIEPHEAPVEDFPKQPSQKDGLGRMCKTHWNEYTAGLAREAKARKAATGGTAEPAPPAPVKPASAPKQKRAKGAVVTAEEGGT